MVEYATAIFDMDGVIADTQKPISEIESEFFAGYGITISAEEITQRFSGVSSREMIPAVFAEHRRPLLNLHVLCEERSRLVMAMPDEAIVGIPGSVEMIRRWHARNFRMAVASASRPAFIERVLGILQLRSCFRAIASSHEPEVVSGKPAPDVFLLAAKRLGVDPRGCIVIEDGEPGMIGARKAGMRCIALRSNGRRDYPVANLVVNDLREVPDEWIFDRS